MPRAKVESEEVKIMRFFRTASVERAKVVLAFAKEELTVREERESVAKAQAEIETRRAASKKQPHPVQSPGPKKYPTKKAAKKIGKAARSAKPAVDDAGWDDRTSPTARNVAASGLTV